jgi:hypothetical protein
MAKIRAIGADVQLVTRMEATYGTPPAVEWRPVYASRFSGGGSKGLGYEPELGLGADAQDPFYDAQNVDFEMDVHIGVRRMGHWLKRLLGAPVTTGTGPYTHVFSSGGDIPSFSIEEGYPTLTTPRYYQRSGVKLGQMTIPFRRMGPAVATLTGIGQQLTKSNASIGVNGAPLAALAGGQFMMNAMTLKKDGAALPFQLTGGNLVFSNNLRRVETVGRGDGLIEGADEGDRTATGSLEMVMTSDQTLYGLAMTTETSFAFLTRWTTPIDAAFKLDLLFGRVFVSWGQPGINNPGDVGGPITWRAAKDGSNPLLIATLINDQASYAGDNV